MRTKTLEDWLGSGISLRLLGRRIFVRTAVTPQRPPLLLIHGYPTASYDWYRVWDALAARYSLYALDLLGFGSSDKPLDSRYAIDEQADFCMALLDVERVGPVDVLAHDYGDTVAQELLARERDGRVRLRSVAFLNGGLFPETHRPRRVQQLLATPVLGDLLARAMTYRSFESTMLAISGATPPTREELADLWSLIELEDGKRALARLIDYMRQRRVERPRWVGALIESTVPRMLICGAEDPISGRHLAERYRELVPAPRVELLEGVGHYPQLEVPERVLEAYFAFRDQLSRP